MQQNNGPTPAAPGTSTYLEEALRELNRRTAKIESAVEAMQQLLESQQIEKEWYSTADVADIMDVKQYTVQERWCNQGRIECMKDDNGKWRIPGSEVRRLRGGGGLAPANDD